MADVSWASVCWTRRGVCILRLFWISIVVPPSLLQPPLPLSLPVHMSVVPPSWQVLPLSQTELGPLFSNSSPFSFSQSLFMEPPPSQAPRPGLQASFGPYSVTQLISEPVLPLSPLLSASLLSEHVERGRDKRFRVRMLFHKRGDTSTRGTCITLHAFKETEEHKGSCITQPPLGLCVVILTLPTDWFEGQHTNQSHQDLEKWHSNTHFHRRWEQKRERQRGRRHHSNFVNHRRTTTPSLRQSGRGPFGLEQCECKPAGDPPVGGNHAEARYQQVPTRNQIQLYYSSSDAVADLKLTPPGCMQDGAAQSQKQLFHIKAVTLKDEEEEEEEEREQNRTKEEETCLNGQEEEELSLDPHVMILYHRGPVLIGEPIKVSVKLRANVSAEFVVIRLKVKKGLVSMVSQKTVTSDLWTITLEKSQGSKHDVLSILVHKQSTFKVAHKSSSLQQVVCLSVNGLRQSFGVAMMVSAQWWLEYSGRISLPSPHGAAVSIFSFVDRHIFSIAPITESNTIINTAILTNQPLSLPVIVLAVNHDGKVSDVTSAVTCHSTDENTVKVSGDCSTLFVDGSESGLGSTCAVVEFLLGALRGSMCVEVWAPSVPLRVSLADPILNAIDGWNHFTKEGCEPVYQRSSVQVLTQFTAQDSHGRTTHLLGSSDWFVDVTELVRDWLRVGNPRVAALDDQNNLIGLQPGKTSLHVVSEQWDGVLGRCDITVSSDPVTPGDLSVQVVSGLGMSVMSSPAHPSIITTTVTAYNTLHNHHQEAFISVWLQFSDDSASLLSSFSDLPFLLRLSSLAETVVVVTPDPGQRIFAQGDGGGPLLRAELLVSTCAEQPSTSNSISEGGGWTRRLARGSGWIRVNLDLGVLQPAGDQDEKFELDMLVESDGDIYDEDDSENVSSDYDDKLSRKRNWKEAARGGMVSRNNLERAMLMPRQEEGAVFFSPSQEGEKRREEEVEGQGAGELEVGVGAVLSLLCLSAVLFMANCLPCVMRDKRRTMMEEERDRQLEGGAKEEEEMKKTEGEDKREVDNKENVKEVEIISAQICPHKQREVKPLL